MVLYHIHCIFYRVNNFIASGQKAKRKITESKNGQKEGKENLPFIFGEHITRYVNQLACFVILFLNRVGGVMVSVLASSAIDRGFEPRSGQTKHYKIGICCFSVKHAALRRKSKDWLSRNQNNVSEWSDMSTHGLLFQWASTIKFQLSVLV